MNTIKNYNDRCRKALVDKQEFSLLQAEGCFFRVMMTASFQAEFDETARLAALKTIAEFDDFTEDNDPYGEHDFIICQFEGQTIYAKFDYYDATLEHGSPDPDDLSQTYRVLTLMLPLDY